MSINPPSPTGVKTRLSLRELELTENSQKKNDFLKALREVQKLPADNPSSFWSIASYHGMPFDKRQVQEVPPGEAAWDGYSQHSNVLFPTWHRFYCLKLEQSLQAAVPDGDVMLPYWDQTSEASRKHGLPPLLTDKTVTIDGADSPNPLLNFIFPREITKPSEPNNHDANALYYVKPKGYTTVRYPFSGIKNPETAKETADKHNQSIDELDQDPDKMLNDNVRKWLNTPYNPSYNSILDEYKIALEQSHYNKFSNTSSSNGSKFCLEQANNDIHLSVGGFTSPSVHEDGSVKVDEDGNVINVGLSDGANGDMGENETASFDPCFFMHHCNVDRMFWVWQKKWGHTTSIPLEESSADSGLTNGAQGPSPYQTPNQHLNFQTALHPFTNKSKDVVMTSSDCFNIEKLGYQYSIGSLDQESWPPHPITHKFVELVGKSWKDVVHKLKNAVKAAKEPLVVSFDSTHFAPATPESPILPLQHKVTDKVEDEPSFIKIGRDRFRVRNYLSVKNINKNSIDGSFVVQAYYKRAGKLYFIGQRGVLSRWSREIYSNSMQHPNMTVCFAVNHILPDLKDLSNIVIIIASKDPETGKLIQTRVVQGEQVVFGKGSFKPTIHITTSYEQELLGAMEQQAVA